MDDRILRNMVMDKLLITIITVCKNDIAGLQATEGSIRSQSERSFEWVVIDGASTDGTHEYLSGLGLGYLRFWIEADESQFEAMNKGIERAQGDYLLFLNAGDTLHDREVLTGVAQKVGNEDWLIGDAVDLIGGNMRIYKRARSLGYMRHSLPSSHQAIFFRKGAIGDIRYRSEEFQVSGDYAFAAEIYRSDRRSAVNLGIPVCVFRLGGLSTQNRAGLLRDAWRVQKEILGLKLPFRIVSYVYRFISMFLLDNYSRLYMLLRSGADRFTKVS